MGDAQLASGGHEGGSVWRRIALPLGLTLWIQITANVALLSVAVLAPVIAASVGVETEWVGYYIAIAYATGATTSIYSARIIRPLGPMTAGILAMALSGFGLLIAASNTLVGLALAAVPIGLAYGLTNPTSSEILAKVTPQRLYGRVFSLKQTSVPGGGLIAGLVGPPVEAAYGWPATLQLLAGLIFLSILAFLPYRRRFDGRSVPKISVMPRSSPLSILTASPSLRALALACFCLAGVQLTVTTFFVSFAVEEALLPLATAGLLFACLQAVGVPGRIVWGWLADAKLGNRRGLAWQAFLALIGMALLSLAEPDWAFSALLGVALLLGLSIMTWTGLMIAAAVATAPDEPGPATAAMMTFAFTGVVVVPPLAGTVSQVAGTYAAGFTLAGVIALAALGLVLRARALALREAEAANGS